MGNFMPLSSPGGTSTEITLIFHWCYFTINWGGPYYCIYFHPILTPSLVLKCFNQASHSSFTFVVFLWIKVCWFWQLYQDVVYIPPQVDAFGRVLVLLVIFFIPIQGSMVLHSPINTMFGWWSFFLSIACGFNYYTSFVLWHIVFYSTTVSIPGSAQVYKIVP